MDELTSVNTPASVAPPQAGQAPPTSQPPTTPQPQSDGGTTPGGSTPASPTPAKVNLQEFPEFKKLQGQWEQTRQQERAEYQRQLAEYQRQIDETRMAQMDDLEKAEFRAQRAEAYAQYIAQEAERSTLEQKRWSKLNEIASETGVPLEAIQDAPDPANAWRAAALYVRAQTEQLATQRASEIRTRTDANRPDLGGGSLASPVDASLRAAWDSRDPAAYIRAVREYNAQR